jgi:DNA-binding LacI/PurR family transcriptional regulator
MIGIVLSYDPDEVFADPNLLQAIHGVDVEITQRDYVLLLSCASSANDRVSAFRRLLGGYRVDGVIVESGLGEEGISLLAERGYPCVVVGHTENGLPCVHPDDYGGARCVTEHLLALGHQRVGIINAPGTHSLAGEARLGGHLDALATAGLAFKRELVTQGTWRAESGYAGAAQLMGLAPPPTAIFAFNDRMAFGAIRWLREHGYRVPGDVSVAGFDDIESAAQFTPPLTTVRQQPTEIGKRAAQMLFELIAEEEKRERTTVLPTELIVRRSTAPVREEVYSA